jgi:hypothetical protein
MWITHLCFISYLVLVDKVRLWLRKLYYSIEQIPSWEANRFAACEEFPTFYGTWRFITAFTSAHHLSLYWASPIQFIPPHPTSWRFILILSSHLCLGFPVVSFPQVSPPKPCTGLSHTCYMPHPSDSSQFYHLHNSGCGVQIMKVLIMRFSPLSLYLVPLRPKYSSQHPILKCPQSMYLPQCQRPTLTPI